MYPFSMNASPVKMRNVLEDERVSYSSLVVLTSYGNRIECQVITEFFE